MNSLNPEKSPEASPQEVQSDNDFEHPVETRKNSRMAFYIAFLALFFTAVGITVGYKHWLRIDDKAAMALEEINLIKQQLVHTADKNKVAELQANLTQSSSDTEQNLLDSLTKLGQIREQTLYSAQTVTRQIAELTHQQSTQKQGAGSAVAAIQLAEVRFLLSSAKQRLLMNYNKKSALYLLKAADNLLIQIAAPRLLPVREKLAQDITNLEQFTPPNIVALSKSIRSLEKDIKPLIVLEKELTNGKEMALFKQINENSISGKIKGYLNNSVSIRKQTNLPSFAPTLHEKKQIDQALRLSLESLRLMAMQHYNEEYHQQIQSIQQMLISYYSKPDAAPWMTTLTQLDALNVAPKPPVISTALDQLLELQLNMTASSSYSKKTPLKPAETKDTP